MSPGWPLNRCCTRRLLGVPMQSSSDVQRGWRTLHSSAASAASVSASMSCGSSCSSCGSSCSSSGSSCSSRGSSCSSWDSSCLSWGSSCPSSLPSTSASATNPLKLAPAMGPAWPGIYRCRCHRCGGAWASAAGSGLRAAAASALASSRPSPAPVPAPALPLRRFLDPRCCFSHSSKYSFTACWMYGQWGGGRPICSIMTPGRQVNGSCSPNGTMSARNSSMMVSPSRATPE
mmetsp:Transcript_93499/g.264432  ORF Transcript_93499/g.264432 Transcript_93499/m.264432 type:complete len:232 (+) Transcript_93499:144-839(+)